MFPCQFHESSSQSWNVWSVTLYCYSRQSNAASRFYLPLSHSLPSLSLSIPSFLLKYGSSCYLGDFKQKNCEIHSFQLIKQNVFVTIGDRVISYTSVLCLRYVSDILLGNEGSWVFDSFFMCIAILSPTLCTYARSAMCSNSKHLDSSYQQAYTHFIVCSCPLLHYSNCKQSSQGWRCGLWVLHEIGFLCCWISTCLMSNLNLSKWNKQLRMFRSSAILDAAICDIITLCHHHEFHVLMWCCTSAYETIWLAQGCCDLTLMLSIAQSTRSWYGFSSCPLLTIQCRPWFLGYWIISLDLWLQVPLAPRIH